MKTALAVAKGIPLAAIAIAVAHLSSCAPKPVNPLKPVQQVQPIKTPSASPVLDDARKVSGDADTQAAIAAERLARAQAGASTAQQRAKAALAEAERLRVQKTATEKELANQSKLVRELGEAMDALESDLAAVSQSLLSERGLRQKISVMLVEAQTKATQKDQEADQLRAQLNQAEVQANSYYLTAEANAKAAMAAQERVASAQGATKTWRWIAIWIGISLLVSLLLHWLRSYI